jgi:transposase-like protein
MNIVEIYEKFPSNKDCLDYLEQVRWKGKPVCPYCQSPKVTPLPKENRHHCNTCNTSFSVTVRTIFHKTKLPLQKWFLAICLILNAKKGISARQLARDIKVNKDTAWYMGMRIRRAMIEQRDLMMGIVEMDETYIGGKPRKGNGGGHNKRGRGTKKIPVIGIVQRGGDVKARPAKNLTGKTLRALVRENVNVPKATIITDEFSGYARFSTFIKHQTVDHQVWYVDGQNHTNTIESFWALLKRGIIGQYHKVSIRHLPKYIDEFCYRHNNRKNIDIFAETITRAIGGI